MRSDWGLAPDVIHLNHGSFGACPTAILERQSELRARLERDSMQFFVYDLRALLDEARHALARFLACSAEELVFVPNATTAVNAVVRSFPFERGDQLLTTDHCYNACHNVLNYVAAERGLEVVVAELVLPVSSPEQIVDRVLASVTPRTRLALLDHITSPTAMVMPVRELVAALERRGVRCLVDGAHAPGMVPLAIDEVGASFYTGNLHKWLCAPKQCAFLHARAACHDWLVPAVISHGLNLCPAGVSRYQALFDWTGTVDPTPWLCIPALLEFWERRGGMMAAAESNRAMLLAAVERLNARLETALICPTEMLGTMAALQLPAMYRQVSGGSSPTTGQTPTPTQAVQNRLWADYKIQVPVVDWKQQTLLLRISAHCYNRAEEYESLAEAMLQIAEEA